MNPTPRTTLRRIPDRGSHDRSDIDAILDEALIAHVSFVHEGVPCVIPTAFVRVGDQLVIHGASKSRMIERIVSQEKVSACVTLLDAYVMAKSAFHHSLNYRSVVIFGKALLVESPEEKVERLRQFTEKVAPGRWDEVRPPNEQELKATSVATLPLDEASAKIRRGPPKDDPEDQGLPVWSGVVPILTRKGEPQADDFSKTFSMSEAMERWRSKNNG